MKLEFVNLGHCELAVRVVGEGRDVVCVHGWPLHGMTFRNIAAAMPGYRFHLIDLPGAGATKVTAETNYAIADQARTVVAYVEKVGLESCVLMAHDSGGAVARYAVEHIRDRVEALVLSDTEIPNEPSFALVALLWGSHLPGTKQSIRLMFSNSTVRRTKISLGGCFRDPDGHEEFEELFIKPLLERDEVIEGYMNIAKGITLADLNKLKAIHEKIECPTLLLWGEDDPFFSANHARKMAEQFQNATFVAHPEGKLFMHEEFSEWFAAETLKFLESI